MTVKTTTAVGSYPSGVSPYGAHDMAGNVDEWVADWFDQDYYQRSPERNPQGPESGPQKVLRGGSWFINVLDLRSSNRFNLSTDYRFNFIGFRCARGLP